MIDLFEHCPACGGPIVITECRCASCSLQMRGEFRPGHFSSLSGDQLNFIRVFMRTRGNLSEVEKVLGVSYPTIRNKLDEVNAALERDAAAPDVDRGNLAAPAAPTAGPADDARRAILQQVASGAVPASEALQKLRNLQGGK